MTVAPTRHASSWSLRLAFLTLAAFAWAVVFETPIDYAPFVTLAWFDRAMDAGPGLVVVALLLATMGRGLLEFKRGYRKQGVAAMLVAALIGGVIAVSLCGYLV